MFEYETIFKSLNKAKVKFLVVGGVAVNLHGFFRATADLDIVLLLNSENIDQFIKVVKKFKLKPRISVQLEDFADENKRKEWIKKKHMRAFALYDPTDWIKHLDIVIDYSLNFNDIYKRRKTITDGPLKIPVISIKDLIKMKKDAGRQRDNIDIKALKMLEKINDKKNKK